MPKSLYVENSYANLGEKFLNINNTITFFFYVKLVNYSISGATSGSFISQNIDGSSPYRAHLLISADGKPSSFIGAVEPSTVSSNNIIEKNKWVCIAYVIDKTNFKMYVDGDLEIEREVTNYYNDNTWLFAYERGKRNFLNAYISELRIYNYALAQEQIINKMNKKENNYSELLRYYNFNEVINNNIIPDLTGNYNLPIGGFKYLSEDIPEFLKDKYLIKQNNEYYTIAQESYVNGTYQPLVLEGGATPNDNDFISKGFDNLNLLTTEYDKNSEVDVSKSIMGEGKYFEVEFSNDFKRVNSVY